MSSLRRLRSSGQALSEAKDLSASSHACLGNFRQRVRFKQAGVELSYEGSRFRPDELSKGAIYLNWRNYLLQWSLLLTNTAHSDAKMLTLHPTSIIQSKWRRPLQPEVVSPT